MNRSFSALLLSGLVLGLAPHALAQSAPGRLSAKVLAQVQSIQAAQAPGGGAGTNRPFLLDPEDPLPEVNFNPRLERERISGSCSASGGSLCYDYRTGRAVYRPAREWMPEIQGMRRESLSVRRNKVVLHYSF